MDSAGRTWGALDDVIRVYGDGSYISVTFFFVLPSLLLHLYSFDTRVLSVNK